MNEHLSLSPTLARHAAQRAAEPPCDADRRCRRWRRIAIVCRCVALTLLLALTAVATNHTLVGRTLWSHGALTAQQASYNVTQMLLHA